MEVEVEKEHFFGVAVGVDDNTVFALLDEDEGSVAEALSTTPDVATFRHAGVTPDPEGVESGMVDALLALDDVYGMDAVVSMRYLFSGIFELGYRAALKDYPEIQKARQRYAEEHPE